MRSSVQAAWKNTCCYRHSWVLPSPTSTSGLLGVSSLSSPAVPRGCSGFTERVRIWFGWNPGLVLRKFCLEGGDDKNNNTKLSSQQLNTFNKFLRFLETKQPPDKTASLFRNPYWLCKPSSCPLFRSPSFLVPLSSRLAHTPAPGSQP